MEHLFHAISSSVCSVFQQLLTSDWAVLIPEEDHRDGCEYEAGIYLSESQVHEIETEFLKEKLQEIYLQAKEQEVLPEEVNKNKNYYILCVSEQNRHQGGRVAARKVFPAVFLIHKTSHFQK